MRLSCEDSDQICLATAASSLENTTGEQRTLHKFSANFTRRFIRVRVVS